VFHALRQYFTDEFGNRRAFALVEELRPFSRNSTTKLGIALYVASTDDAIRPNGRSRSLLKCRRRGLLRQVPLSLLQEAR
jgi:hypothetical protein